jgi:primosomal protein N' (replication factor Y)
MQRALAAGKSALLLVPEIGLTPGTAAQMVAAFGGEVALLHSAAHAGRARGAVAPHPPRRGAGRHRHALGGLRADADLGLILVDEEHDGSYKQEETPRYHGRDVAVMRAKFNGRWWCWGRRRRRWRAGTNSERGRYQRIEMLSAGDAAGRCRRWSWSTCARSFARPARRRYFRAS